MTTNWSPEQLANANTIIQVGNQLGATQRDITIALMTAMQESGLININYGDQAGPDSLGLFQQRAPWGTAQQRMDPAESARMFFEGGHTGQPGLFSFSNRNSMSLTQAAQAVQVSAFPSAYAKWQGDAESILGANPGSTAPAPLQGPRIGGTQAVAPGALASAGLNTEAAPAAPLQKQPGLQLPDESALSGESQSEQLIQAKSTPINQMEQSVVGDEKSVAGSEKSVTDADNPFGSPAAMQASADSQFLRPMTLDEFTQNMGGATLPGSTLTSNTPGVSGVGGSRQTMLQKALAQVGTPYVWGGTAPGGFDCSGLVQWAYAQAGINLPRISYQQADAGKRVPLSQLQAGDLVAMDESNRNGNANADHIAIYLGNNQLLEAPAPGENVRVRTLSAWDQANAWGVSMDSYFNNAAAPVGNAR